MTKTQISIALLVLFIWAAESCRRAYVRLQEKRLELKRLRFEAWLAAHNLSTVPEPCMTSPRSESSDRHLIGQVSVCMEVQAGDHECLPETIVEPVEIPPSMFGGDHGARRFAPGPVHVRCQVCKRPLASHASQQRGFGPVCAAKVRALELTPRDT